MSTLTANAALDRLRRFEPMDALDWQSLATLARHAREVRLPPQRMLVMPGRRLPGTWFLLSGTLQDESSGARLRGGPGRCRAAVYPGHAQMRALTWVTLLWVDDAHTNLLSPTQAEVGPLPELLVDHWLGRLAASPLLRLLYQRQGASGWQRWLRAFEKTPVRAGTTLIDQGAPADWFYLLSRGQARVRYAHGDVVINPGGFFGEDALLTGQPRNASVVMLTHGEVLRGDPALLRELVTDLWWVLARRPNAWQADDSPVRLPTELTTAALREWLDKLPLEQTYGLLVAAQTTEVESGGLTDLALLLLVHRGYQLALRSPQ